MFTVCYSLEVIFKCILFKAPLLSVPCAPCWKRIINPLKTDYSSSCLEKFTDQSILKMCGFAHAYNVWEREVCVWKRQRNPACVCLRVNKYCEKGSGLNPKGRAESHTCLNISMRAMGLCARIIPLTAPTRVCLHVERIPAGVTLPRCTGGLNMNIQEGRCDAFLMTGSHEIGPLCFTKLTILRIRFLLFLCAWPGRHHVCLPKRCRESQTYLTKRDLGAPMSSCRARMKWGHILCIPLPRLNPILLYLWRFNLAVH